MVRMSVLDKMIKVCMMILAEVGQACETRLNYAPNWPYMETKMTSMTPKYSTAPDLSIAGVVPNPSHTITHSKHNKMATATSCNPLRSDSLPSARFQTN